MSPLQTLARHVEAYQAEQGISTAALIRRVPQLGSDKTFKRFLAGDFAETDVEKWVAEYQAAVNWIASTGASAPEELIDSLSPVLLLSRAWREARKTSGNGRVVLMLGKSGSGKSSAVRHLMQKQGSGIRLVEANEAWNDSPSAMLAAILRALDITAHPASAADRLEAVVQRLNESRHTLVIEEAHHLRCRLLDIVKTLVNRTPGEFVLVAIDTLWTRMATPAYEQARQLTGNRIAEVVRLAPSPTERDIAALIAPAKTEGPTAELIASLRTIAQSAGQLAFIRDVVARVLAQCADDKTTNATLAHWQNAIAAERGSR